MTTILRLLVLGGLVAALRWLPHYFRRQRSRDATPYLSAKGFLVYDAPAPAPTLPFPEFRHEYAKVEFSITRRDRPGTAFQYRYLPAGRRSAGVGLSCAVLPLPFSIPIITIKRGRTSIPFPASGVRIETDLERFDQMFEVTSIDERGAFTLLSYEVMEWFLAPSWLAEETTFRVCGTHLLATRPQVDELLLPNLLKMADSLRATFPSVLAELYPPRPG